MTQIRSPKQDSQDVAESANQLRPEIELGIWDLGFASDFGLRISDFTSDPSAS